MATIQRDFRSLAVLALSLGAWSCASERSQHAYLHKTEHPPAAQWGYSGDIGPAHWGDLSADYALAKTGKQQSPIDIVPGAPEEMPAITFDYHPTKIDLVYNGHTVEEMDDHESAIEIDGDRYVLQQFHFHSPSEHTVNGRHSEMEMHLVHKDGNGRLAVVSVMLQQGAENAAFGPIWSDKPTDANRKRESTVQVDVAKLLPADRGYYRYDGSLTTPPCSEGVLWLVLRQSVQLSKGQIDAFRAVISGNNRPVPPLNGRTVKSSR